MTFYRGSSFIESRGHDIVSTIQNRSELDYKIGCVFEEVIIHPVPIKPTNANCSLFKFTLQ